MRALKSGLIGLFSASAFLLAGMGAKADIIFCNKFSQTIWVAIAYPQGDDRWLSRGWMSLGTQQCAPFDNALRIGTFYFRAESVPYRDENGRRVRRSWGNGRSFAIWEDNNFNYWDAQDRVLNSSLAEFTKGPQASNGAVSATIIFTENGSSLLIK